MTLEEATGSATPVWPDNVESVNMFVRVSTQWIVGPSGPIGLNYPAIYPLLDRQFASADEWDAVLDDIRILEDAALETMRKENK